MTPGRRATSAKPALFAECPENSSVAENVEQRLRMRRSWREKGKLQPGCRPEGLAREGGSAVGYLHPIRKHRWKFTTCTQQRHGTNCVWPTLVQVTPLLLLGVEIGLEIFSGTELDS